MSIEYIWQQYHSRLLGFLMKQTSNHAVAEDILQQVFIKLLQNPPRVQHGAVLEAWLIRVCRTSFIDHYRQNSQKVIAIDTAPAAELTTVNQSELVNNESNPVLLNCMHNALTMLPKDQARAIHAADLNQIPHLQLAREYDVSPSTVRSWVTRGRKQLKQRLQYCQTNDCACDEFTPVTACCAVLQRG